MDIFNYDAITGEFISQTVARENPLEPGEFLFPAHATAKPLPALQANEAAVFNATLDDWEVKPDYRGVTYYLIADGSEMTFDLGEAPDATVSLTKTDSVILEELKQVKSAEIRAAFEADAETPIEIAGVLYHGGLDSSVKLDGAFRLAEKASLTSVTFTDINNIAHTLTLAEADSIILTIGQAYQAAFMRKQQKLVDVVNAVDAAAVELINY